MWLSLLRWLAKIVPQDVLSKFILEQHHFVYQNLLINWRLDARLAGMSLQSQDIKQRMQLDHSDIQPEGLEIVPVGFWNAR